MVDRVCTAPGAVAYVAEEEGRLVGWAQALGDGVLQSHLGFVAVHPDARRRGIARLLVVATFQATGTKRMDLITDAAEEFYAASPTSGWRASGSTPGPSERFSGDPGTGRPRPALSPMNKVELNRLNLFARLTACGAGWRPPDFAVFRTRRYPHGTCGRHRPRHDEQRRRRPRGWRTHRHRKRGRRPHHPVGRRVRQVRRGAGRRGRQAPGRHQRRPDDPLGQAPHGHRLEAEDRRQGLHAAADQRVRAAEAQARRRGLPRRAGHRRGDHGAGVLLRRAAPGHQGGRRDRGPQRVPHRQRADRGRAGLRPRQGRRPDDPRLRPRWRHVRRVPARDRRGRRRGQGDLRRQPPRW